MRFDIVIVSSLIALAGTALAEETGDTLLDIPVEIGQSVKEIRVPHYGADGSLSLRLNSTLAERASRTGFNFQDLRIEIFDRDRTDKASLEVVVGAATFDQSTRQLTSDRRAVIKGDNMTITGSRLKFDVATRTSRLDGPVTMTLVNTGMATP
jgi:hypothetical protein